MAQKYNRDAMRKEITHTVKQLPLYKGLDCDSSSAGLLMFYDDNNNLVAAYDVSSAVDEVIQQYEETGNTTAELRYDGIKYFTQDIILAHNL